MHELSGIATEPSLTWRAGGRPGDLFGNGTQPAEGLCSLAWVIVNEKVRVPWDVIEEILEFTAELVDEEFMPPNLGEYALPESSPS